MKIGIASLASSVLMLGFVTTAAAQQDKQQQIDNQKDTQNSVCAQGTYSWPCPKAVWCPSERCGIGIPKANGEVEIIYASEPKMSGLNKKLVTGGQQMSLEHLAGRVIVFEYEDDGEPAKPGSDLRIKDIYFVVMPSPRREG